MLLKSSKNTLLKCTIKSLFQKFQQISFATALKNANNKYDFAFILIILEMNNSCIFWFIKVRNNY